MVPPLWDGLGIRILSVPDPWESTLPKMPPFADTRWIVSHNQAQFGRLVLIAARLVMCWVTPEIVADR